MAEDRACPDCDSVMRKTRVGGGVRRQDAWLCPRSEAELSVNERGHIVRASNPLHEYLRVWTASELEELDRAVSQGTPA